MTNALIIDLSGEVREHTGPLTLDFYQETVGGWVQAVWLDAPEGSLWMHEEGKLIGMPPNELATRIYWQAQPHHMQNDYVAGVAIVTGGTDDEGDTLPPSTELIAFVHESAARVAAG